MWQNPAKYKGDKKKAHRYYESLHFCAGQINFVEKLKQETDQ